MEVKEQIMDERKFLHELSNQLVVAQGMGSFVSRALVVGEVVTEKEVERMQKTIGALERMIHMVRDRRETLHTATQEVD